MTEPPPRQHITRSTTTDKGAPTVTITPSTNTHPLDAVGRFRLWAACAVAALVLWAVWTIPFPATAVDTIAASDDPAVRGAVNSGWWAVIVAVCAVAFGSLIAVVIDYQRGRDWPLTALRSTLKLLAIAAGTWCLWTVIVLGALDAAARS